MKSSLVVIIPGRERWVYLEINETQGPWCHSPCPGHCFCTNSFSKGSKVKLKYFNCGWLGSLSFSSSSPCHGFLGTGRVRQWPQVGIIKGKSCCGFNGTSSCGPDLHCRDYCWLSRVAVNIRGSLRKLKEDICSPSLASKTLHTCIHIHMTHTYQSKWARYRK